MMFSQGSKKSSSTKVSSQFFALILITTTLLSSFGGVSFAFADDEHEHESEHDHEQHQSVLICHQNEHHTWVQITQEQEDEDSHVELEHGDFIIDESHPCPPAPPQTDLCTNIDGVQSSIPEGYESLSAGQCTPIPPTPPVCSETQHLDNNICVDNQVTPPVTPPTDTPPSTDTGHGGGGNGPIFGSLPSPDNSGGSNVGFVLGTSTTATPSCSTRFNHFIMHSNLSQNDPTDVKDLQTFLNDFQHAGLAVDGIYGPETIDAVKLFQNNHKKEVLDVWPTTATGNFYLATRWAANAENCKMLGQTFDLKFPTLSPFKK